MTARSREEANAKVKASGKLGFAIGQVELGGGVGSERGSAQGRETERQYKVRTALPLLRIELVKQ